MAVGAEAMITITIPADLEATLAEAARARSVTPTQLAINCLRETFATRNPKSEAPGGNARGFSSRIHRHC
jgi:hypothetical protein